MHMSHLIEFAAAISATDWQLVSHTLCVRSQTRQMCLEFATFWVGRSLFTAVVVDPPGMRALSFITASLQQFLWCSIVERLEHLVLSVCFPSYCLLTPLMSPKDKRCKLIDCGCREGQYLDATGGSFRAFMEGNLESFPGTKCLVLCLLVLSPILKLSCPVFFPCCSTLISLLMYCPFAVVQICLLPWFLQMFLLYVVDM